MPYILVLNYGNRLVATTQCLACREPSISLQQIDGYYKKPCRWVWYRVAKYTFPFRWILRYNPPRSCLTVWLHRHHGCLLQYIPAAPGMALATAMSDPALRLRLQPPCIAVRLRPDLSDRLDWGSTRLLIGRPGSSVHHSPLDRVRPATLVRIFVLVTPSLGSIKG